MQITGSYKLTDKAFGGFAGERKNLGITEPNLAVGALSENYDSFIQGVLSSHLHLVFVQPTAENEAAWNAFSTNSLRVSVIRLATDVRWREYDLNVMASSGAQYGLSSAEARLDELRRCAQDEGIPMNAKSLADIRLFIGNRGFPEELNIFLLDNGNFHVIWDLGPEEEYGIEFLGNRTIKQTTIRVEPGSRRVKVSSETTNFDSVVRPFSNVAVAR